MIFALIKSTLKEIKYMKLRQIVKNHVNFIE